MRLPSTSTFEPRHDIPALGDGEIHVWSLGIAQAHHSTVGAAAREALQRCLCAYAGLSEPPPIERGEHGKPFAPALPELDFNLSHADGQVLLAFARRQALGVDVERIDRRVSPLPLARRFFAPEEAAALARLPPSRLPVAFVHLWTRKEAVLKALGQGIGFGLHRLAFDVDDQGRVGGLHRIAPDAGSVGEWQVRVLAPADGFTAALAWRGSEREVRLFAGVP